MTPIDQSPDHPEGNCLQAAVASLLDLTLDEVPDLSKHDRTWFKCLVEWARDRGLGVVQFKTAWSVPSIHNVWAIAVGNTKRGTGRHTHAVVVWMTTKGEDMHMEMKHDPHPSRAFLDTVKYCFFFVPMEGY